MNKIKSVLFVAGISLALVFTLSCGGVDTDKQSSESGISSSSSKGVNNSSSSSSTGISSSSRNSSSSSVVNSSSSSLVQNSSSSVVLKECDAIFNPDNKFCYDGTVYDKCGGKIYNPPTQECVGGSVLEGKCGGQYNQTKQFCYDGTVYDKCGNPPTTYNPTKQGCANGKVVDTKCGSGWYYQEKQFCYDGTVYDKCDGMEYPPATHICQNKVAVPAKCGGESYNPVTQKCQNNAIFSKCGSVWYNQQTQFCENNGVYNKCNKSYDIQTQYCSNGTVKDYSYIIDTRDGKKYKTVLIGTQTWMAENLNYAAEGSRCYNDSTAYCDKYGRLYNWETVCSPRPDDCYGTVICPKGWGLPEYAQWDAMAITTGGAGAKLMATSGWGDYSPEKSYNGTDDFGFSALPGGGYLNGGFSGAGNSAFWWTFTRQDSKLRPFTETLSGVSGYIDKSYLSVRCMVDKPLEGEFCNYGACQGGSGSSCKNGGCFRMPTDDNCISGTLVSTCPSGTKPPEADW